ncbi:hypothetical protein, partial [Thiohalocapsa sp.]|uniref:hypothetical protein n=1 Tax=Thiohalocapsa sp. TaxID=2497641 RepID=UPI0025F4445F
MSPGATFAVLPSSRHRKHPLGRLLLACALLLAQTLLAAHGIAHLAHVDEDLCAVCLAGTHPSSYSHLTLPTERHVHISVVPVPTKKTPQQATHHHTT